MECLHIKLSAYKTKMWERAVTKKNVLARENLFLDLRFVEQIAAPKAEKSPKYHSEVDDMQLPKEILSYLNNTTQDWPIVTVALETHSQKIKISENH